MIITSITSNLSSIHPSIHTYIHTDIHQYSNTRLHTHWSFNHLHSEHITNTIYTKKKYITSHRVHMYTCIIRVSQPHSNQPHTQLPRLLPGSPLHPFLPSPFPLFSSSSLSTSIPFVTSLDPPVSYLSLLLRVHSSLTSS